MTPDAFAALLDRAYVSMRPWTAQDIAETLASAHSIFLTRPNGGLLARSVAGECEILAFATDPGVQRQGVASSLLQELLDRADATGADTVFLEVASGNAPARAFYAARGFAEIGLRRGYYTLRDGSRDDARLLSRPVAQGHVYSDPA